FPCPDPHRTDTSKGSERVVTDELGWSLEIEGDGSGGKRTHRTEFVRDAENDSRGIGSVSRQGRVIGAQLELVVDTIAGVSLLDDLLSGPIALDTKISPRSERCGERNNK